MRISDWSSDVCSSDLCQGRCACGCPDRGDHGGKEDGRSYPALPSAAPVRGHRRSASDGGRRTRECERTDHSYDRSEEHTSELQSLMRISYAVFCLKKQKTKYKHNQFIKQHYNIIKQ